MTAPTMPPTAAPTYHEIRFNNGNNLLWVSYDPGDLFLYEYNSYEFILSPKNFGL